MKQCGSDGGLVGVGVERTPQFGGPGGFRICGCIKISFTENLRQVFIIRVGSNLNKTQFHFFFFFFTFSTSQQEHVRKRYHR